MVPFIAASTLSKQISMATDIELGGDNVIYPLGNETIDPSYTNPVALWMRVRLDWTAEFVPLNTPDNPNDDTNFWWVFSRKPYDQSDQKIHLYLYTYCQPFSTSGRELWPELEIDSGFFVRIDANSGQQLTDKNSLGAYGIVLRTNGQEIKLTPSPRGKAQSKVVNPKIN